MATRMPRNEYPRPTMVRPGWINLNGPWRFEFDQGLSGLAEGWQSRHDYTRRILVPFAPEAALSGLGEREFHPGVWYERDLEVPRLGTRRMLLHFGACDYETSVFLNGTLLARHAGGYTPFSVDLSAFARSGRNRLTVYARDEPRSGLQPAGKQSTKRESHGCSYTRTTGLWQTVWAEMVPACYLSRVAAVPERGLGEVGVEVEIEGGFERSLALRLVASAGGREVARVEAPFGGSRTVVRLPVPGARRWSPEDPFLYDLDVELRSGGRVVDRVRSYFGMRSLELTGREFLLNGEPLYQRLVLDQGFYPGGIYTAPSDAALRRDIQLSLAAGFNGARLHQKLFEPRFLYWADRLGYLCWGEAGDWGLNLSRTEAQQALLSEWCEAIRRDLAHPSVIAWVATNERHPGGSAEVGGYLARLTRTLQQLDPGRPVIDNSGYWHTVTDLLDIHDYSQGPVIRKNWGAFARKDRLSALPEVHRPPQWPGWAAANSPVLLSEVGGIGFLTPGSRGWGYGDLPRTRGDFLRRFAETMRAIQDIPNCCGFCYTQLYDVEQEINGLYTYAREPKFKMAAIRRINEARRSTR